MLSKITRSISRFFSSLRDPVSGLTHFFAAFVALGGLVALLVVGWGPPGKTLSLAIYGVSLVTMFATSAAYHMVKARPAVVEILRKVDHSAIYLLIAGAYTPYCINMFSGFWKWGMMAIIWSLALIGIGVKIFIIKTPRWLTAGVYLVMGWLSLAAIGEFLTALPVAAIVWLAAGGVFYTVGAVIYITKKLDFFPGKFGFHEVWHIFVILGALAHFIGVLVYIAPV
ncbi:MAG: hemolysin III family protein [Chloroflexota bacterium]